MCYFWDCWKKKKKKRKKLPHSCLIRCWKPAREARVCGISRPGLIGRPASVCVCVCVCVRKRENFMQFLTSPCHCWIISPPSTFSTCARLNLLLTLKNLSASLWALTPSTPVLESCSETYHPSLPGCFEIRRRFSEVIYSNQLRY